MPNRRAQQPSEPFRQRKRTDASNLDPSPDADSSASLSRFRADDAFAPGSRHALPELLPIRPARSLFSQLHLHPHQYSCDYSYGHHNRPHIHSDPDPYSFFSHRLQSTSVAPGTHFPAQTAHFQPSANPLVSDVSEFDRRIAASDRKDEQAGDNRTPSAAESRGRISRRRFRKGRVGAECAEFPEEPQKRSEPLRAQVDDGPLDKFEVAFDAEECPEPVHERILSFKAEKRRLMFYPF
ncbi:hypothetical protein L596_028016 [Steinernema carpocapsae]|uniref:Uncharacterized protein n=1 Tax=Steinernema carpocapsae TaxID=34508 RepID=A0A4U5LX79_STECR|nr:hypothetical protein L596_028016 [Steinernema carpocapsae]